MSKPEIARRCHKCGASIRDNAFFCPQCGHQLKHDTAPLEPPETHDLDDTVAINLNLDDTIAINKVTADDSKPETKKPKPSVPTRKPARVAPPHVPSPDGPSTGPEAAGRMQRATTRARDVTGDVIQRGHKLREISTVMLDEASYDPSLRFVLVAAALFLLFIVIVILNKLIG